MKKLKLFAFALVFAPLALITAPLGASDVSQAVLHPHINLLKHGTSTNWSGYAVQTNLTTPQNNAVTSVSGQWVVPAVTCPDRTNSYSSIWVGIDGYSSSTVEQLGTEQDCSRGRPVYSAWYEMYPQASFRISLAVKPGDHISASVNFVSRNSYMLMLNNLTTNKHFGTTRIMNNARRSSAEWVVEAPSSFFGILPLSNYGTATITNASATLSSHTGTVSDPLWQNDPLTMTTTGSPAIPRSTPSALSPDGTTFTTTWSHL